MNTLADIAPFRYSAADGKFPVTVEGEIPGDLRGRLIRTAPAGLATRRWQAQHWFDGLGMLYRFDIGRQPTFRSRWLDCEFARQCESGTVRMTSFGTPRNPTFWDWLKCPKPPVTDNCNVNILKHGDDYLALTETAHTLQFDPQSLAVTGKYRYRGNISRAVSNLAHPRFHHGRGDIINLCTRHGPINEVFVTAMKPGCGKRVKLNSWTTRRWPYLHDFGLTEHYAIIIAHPYLANMSNMLWSRSGLASAITHHNDEPTRLIVLPLQGGKPIELKTKPGFVFHLINSFERDDEIVMDVIEHQGSDVLAKLSTDRLASHEPTLGGQAMRLRLDLARRRVTRECLSNEISEFPQINYRDAHMRDYRFAYAVNTLSKTQDGQRRYVSALQKFDVASGEHLRYAEEEWLPGEALFVPRGKPGAREDDGYLLSVASHRSKEQTCCWIIDAKTLTPRARLTVDTLIPLGFHGQFIHR
jgi:beta,beta-carotene 9',10'-dioxygenase